MKNTIKISIEDGYFYVINFENREECGNDIRCEIFDEDGRSFDFLELDPEWEKPIEKQYVDYIEIMSECKTVEDLIDWCFADYAFCGTKKEFEEEFGKSVDENDNDIEVFRIGSKYFVIYDY